MHKGSFLCGVVVCAALLCGRAMAIPADLVPGEEEKGKLRITAGYLAIMQKAWRAAGDLPVDDAHSYERTALAAAKADRDKQIALCKSRAAEFNTETAYIDCWATASRAFAAAIKLKESGLMDGYTGALSAAAGDVDAGKLTKEQARGVYDLLSTINEFLFGALFAAYDSAAEKRTAAEYKDRFVKAYRQGGGTAPVMDSQPPMDDDAVKPAEDVLAKALAGCDNRTDFAGKKAYADCITTADRKFIDAVKLRDKDFYRAYEAQLQAAAAATDAGELTPAQFTAVKEALDDGFNERFLQLQSDYEAVLVKPVTQGYVVRFAAAYGMVKGDHYNDKAAPYDPAAMDQAARDQREAGTKCNNQKAATSATSLECYIAAYRTFAEAIKLRDMQLFEAFVSAMRRAAADTDAGKLAPWQQYAVYEALVRAYGITYQRSYDTYLIALYRPLSQQYVARFDNAYMAAGGTDEETDGPPWNESAVLAARKIRDQAVQSCFDRRAELKTHTAFWECREAAEREMAVAIHTRNMLLTEKMVAATLQAANDADAGKITDDQLGAIAAALGRGSDKLRENIWNSWQAKRKAMEHTP